MADVDLGSRSDLEALSRSGRGKVITLLILFALAVGAAGWFFFLRKQGTGNPEDPTKIAYVGTKAEYPRGLESLGFDVQSGKFDAWVEKAREEVPDLQIESGQEIKAIMAVADRFGYGYVVFEKPSAIDFGPLDLEDAPELTDDNHFAVVTAGDFSFPHVMTVNPKPSEVMRGPTIDLLQALFAQELLAETLPQNDTSSMDAIARRDQLRDAIERLGRIPEMEKKAGEIFIELAHELDEEERAEPKPMAVGKPLEIGTPYPVATGHVLTSSRAYSVVSLDGRKVEIVPDDGRNWWASDAGGEPDDRTECALAFSETLGDSRAQSWMGGDAASILTKTLSSGFTLWTLKEGATDGCAFDKRGPVGRGAPGLGDPRPARHGQVARAGVVGSQGVVSVTTAGASGEEATLGMLDDTELDDVAWLSDRHLIAVGEGHDGPSLYLFDTQTPLSVLRLPASMLQNAQSLHEVAVGRRGDKPVIVVSAGSYPTKLFRIDLPKTLDELFANPPKATEEDAAPTLSDEEAAALEAMRALEAELEPLPSREERGLPIVTSLDSNQFTVEALSHDGDAVDLDVSADGRFVVFLGRAELYDPESPDDLEVVVVATAGGSGPVVLTNNALGEMAPRLTADGSYALFASRVYIDEDWRVTAPRMAKVAR